ncbi:MAG: DUF1648 domain-containing protein [Janthinobacterium lividum]
MSSRAVVIALLTGTIAFLPALYLHLIWPTVPALVPTHFGADGVPDHFSGRQCLWNVVWWPALAFAVLTFLPQVHEGQSFFWSSYQQRQLRWLVVGSVALFLTIFMHHSIKNGKNLPARLSYSTSNKAHIKGWSLLTTSLLYGPKI